LVVIRLEIGMGLEGGFFWRACYGWRVWEDGDMKKKWAEMI
jgi:hypothetical protein